MTQGMAIAITSVRRATQGEPFSATLCPQLPVWASTRTTDTSELRREMEVIQHFVTTPPLLPTKYVNKVYQEGYQKKRGLASQQCIRIPDTSFGLGFQSPPQQSHSLLPRGKTPGSMKVAMLKFASTNRNTSPLYTGMAGEMAFVNQGHLCRRKVTGKGSFGCNTQFLPVHHHHTEKQSHPPPHQPSSKAEFAI